MTDNFDLFKEYIETNFPDFDKRSDSYFTVEIVRRGKDNPDLPAANYHFKTYYINYISDLDKFKDEIIKVCDLLKMRAYITVNRKSYHQVTLNTSAEYSRRVALHDYKKPYTIFEHCSGVYLDKSDKRWVVDIDDNQDPEDYVSIISPEKIILRVPTRSGVHLITRPFRRDKFFEECEKNGLPEIKITQLSLLYENV